MTVDSDVSDKLWVRILMGSIRGGPSSGGWHLNYDRFNVHQPPLYIGSLQWLWVSNPQLNNTNHELLTMTTECVNLMNDLLKVVERHYKERPLNSTHLRLFTFLYGQLVLAG
ncbi:hypothetical protein TNCV_2628821 [Trichonephila clavipes]|uniref:Uncharacterized protein n=1 Tax=Trichonephila clavipes TaxID=2585209 RepID=A0A8X6SNN1_TRICX|nr:hypothetical protein TNCV_2628821 [Trichonephila clavipes]